MTEFAALSALARAFFALWALLICLVNIGSALLSAVRKRYRFAALALVLLAPTYLMWQVIFDLRLFGGTNGAAGLSITLGAFPWAFWGAALALLTLAAGLLLGCNIRYDNTFITPGTIKLFLDRLPCGVCCWRDSGRVLFSNECMNRLCVALTGNRLLNGNDFSDAMRDGILTVDGKVWRFSSRDFSLDAETLHEMVASDITAEYAKTQALERDKAELSQLTRELREYYDGMDEIIRRREILQAKRNIHDEMNRLMLSTVAAGGEDTAALDRIFSLWEQNALLLCMEADETTHETAADSLEKLAAALNLRLVRQGGLPETLNEEQRGLFHSAAQEAVVNAVKHAGAKTMTVSFTETEAGLCCRFENDGTAPSGPVRFTGGLRNLARLADRQGASVSVEVDDVFALVLCFPKNQPDG